REAETVPRCHVGDRLVERPQRPEVGVAGTVWIVVAEQRDARRAAAAANGGEQRGDDGEQVGARLRDRLLLVGGRVVGAVVVERVVAADVERDRADLRAVGGDRGHGARKRALGGGVGEIVADERGRRLAV